MADEINVFDFTDYPNKMTGNFGYLNLSDPTIWTGPYSMMQIVHALYTEYTKDFELLVSNLNNTINAEWEKLETWQGDMETAWATYQENLNTAWAEYQEGLNQAWEKYREGLNQAWATYQEKLNGEWADYKTELNQEWKTMQDSWDDYRTSLNNAWESYQNTMEQKWTAYQTAMEQKWTTYQNTMEQKWTTYQNTMEQQWTTYQTDLNQDWADYQSTMDSAWASYKNSLTTEWNNYKTELSGSWSTYKTDFEKTWADYKKSVTDDLNIWKSYYDDEFGKMVNQWNTFRNDTTTQWEEYQTNVNQDIASFKGTVEQELTVYQKRPTSTTSNGFVRCDIGSMGGLETFAPDRGILSFRNTTLATRYYQFDGSTLRGVVSADYKLAPVMFYHFIDAEDREYAVSIMQGPDSTGGFSTMCAVGSENATDWISISPSYWVSTSPLNYTGFWVPSSSSSGYRLVLVDVNSSSNNALVIALDLESNIKSIYLDTSANFMNYARALIAPAWCAFYGGDLCYWGTKEIDGVSYHRFAFMGGVEFNETTETWTIPTSESESIAEFYLTDVQAETMFGIYLNHPSYFCRGTINGQFYCAADAISQSYPIKIWGITADKNFTEDAPGAVGCYHSFTFNETLVADASNHFFISNIETFGGDAFDIRPKVCALTVKADNYPDIAGTTIKTRYAPFNSILYMFQPQSYDNNQTTFVNWKETRGHLSNVWFDVFTGRLLHLIPNHSLFGTDLSYFGNTRKFNEIHLNDVFFSLHHTVPGTVGYYPEPGYTLIAKSFPFTIFGPLLENQVPYCSNGYYPDALYPIKTCKINAITYDNHYLWPLGTESGYTTWADNAATLMWSLPIVSTSDIKRTLDDINTNGPTNGFLTPLNNLGVRLETSLGYYNQFADLKKCGLSFGRWGSDTLYSDGLTAMPYAMEPSTATTT